MVACVDVRPGSPNGSRPLEAAIVWRIALQRVERCLRPDDLVCAIGGGRLVVCFGHSANGAASGGLGARLASAVGSPLSVDRRTQDIDVVVGIGTGSANAVSEVVGAALNAARALRAKVCTSADAAAPGTARVVVTHVPAGATHRRLPRREVVHAGPGHTNGGGTNGGGSNGSGSNGSRRHMASLASVDVSGHAWGVDLNALLVSLDPLDPQRLNPAIDGLLACLRRAGVTPQVAASPDAEAVIESYKRKTPEVVILALRPEALRANGAFGVGTTWEQWARLTRELVRDGATVLAVANGASVAAVATCVREGAIGILDVGELSEQLEKIVANLSSRRLAQENGSKARALGQGTLPDPYHRLVHLTTSEHRVLFHMMRGSSASEIAEDLIVSLATVRSHIRSILRKLRVRSQLAAVALANGAQPNTFDSD